MPNEVELEGTPGRYRRHLRVMSNIIKHRLMSDSLLSAEAAWAMIFFIVVVMVVLIFCCAVPFYRALEKRYHHWDDIEHDPRYTRDT